MNIPKWIVCSLIIGCPIALLLLPMLRYVTRGWRAKRKDIMDGLDETARLNYFAMFSRSDPLPKAEEAMTEFEKLYGKWYGRRFFVAPGILLFLVATLGIGAVLLTVLSDLKYVPNALFTVPETAIGAFAGAYLWVVNDHIGRSRRLDFSPADVMWAVLRLVTAVPMGYAFAAVAAASAGPFVAFALGAFPLTAVISALRHLATKKLELEPTPEEASDDLIKLQGVNKTIVERLANEDVTTITQIAYCDPVRLTMRSNLSFNFIIDCMNQALAWMYLEDMLAVIRPLGLRGAAEIKYLMDDMALEGSADPQEKAACDKANALLGQIAGKVAQSPETLRFAFEQIAQDPYTLFLEIIWTCPDDPPEEVSCGESRSGVPSRPRISPTKSLESPSS